MSAVFFQNELENVAHFWRIYRPDGITLGFTSHDRDLMFDDIVHRSAPGITPSSVRKTNSLEDDNTQMAGALSHGTISERDISLGRFDNAWVEMGLVDWLSYQKSIIYSGKIGDIQREDGEFSADLVSAKSELARDFIPRTSATCRAVFCGPGCNLSPSQFRIRTKLVGIADDGVSFRFDIEDHTKYLFGKVTWIDGPYAGLKMAIINAAPESFELDYAFPESPEIGASVICEAGCDKTFSTCATRFHNAINFQGEPFLPGNDLLARYPQTS